MQVLRNGQKATLTLSKELHPRSNVGKLYESRMDGGTELIERKMFVKAKENSLGWYVTHHIESLIVAVRIRNTVPSENSTQTKELKEQDNEE